jgi:hypothetical protein
LFRFACIFGIRKGGCTFLFRKETYEKKSALFHERSLLSALLPTQAALGDGSGQIIYF